MHTETLELLSDTPGTRRTLTVMRYGQAGSGPKAYLQAALHADEVPALVVAHVLREKLAALDAAGQILGEVILVPFANPIGLGQTVLGQQQGRFALHDGKNFNRGFADLAPRAQALVQDRLGSDEAVNQRLVREAIRQAAAELKAATPAEDLKRRLLQLAADADVVLDLHCDADAVMHVYALTPQVEAASQLNALLRSHALLLATESGDSPFDESCSATWLRLQQALPQHPLPLACFGATVELRGEADTSLALAQQDADALIDFLRLRGVVAGPAPALPEPLCQATPLSGSEPLTAPATGVVVFHRSPGERVAAGDLIAELVDPESGTTHPIHCRSAGVLYARCGSRWAPVGKRLGKIAGTTLARTGKLLSP